MTPCFFPFWAATMGGSLFSLSRLPEMVEVHSLSSVSPEHDPTNKTVSPFWMAKVNFLFSPFISNGEITLRPASSTLAFGSAS